jgi:hypothetical protein
MRLLALSTAAAALLATGCGGHPCDTGNLTVAWHLENASGLSWSCAAAGVDWIDIYVDGHRQVDAARCTDGVATIFGVPSGSHTVTVEGVVIDSTVSPAVTTVIDRDEFQASVGCGDVGYTATPGEATLDIQYDFTPVNACDAAGSAIWYQVTDTISGDVISSITSHSSNQDKTRFACPNDPVFTIPWGRYRLDWAGEVATPVSNPQVVHEQCTPSVVKSVFAPTTLVFGTTMGLTGSTTCVQ